MPIRAHRAALVVTLLVVECAPANQNLPPPGTRAKVGNDGAEIEMTAEKIGSYVSRGDYKAWIADPAVRDRTQNSPHGKVRVFFNKTSIDALRGNAQQLPVGSMLVKELYKSDGSTLDGYSTMVKYALGSSWTWWEAFVSSLDQPAAFGNDHSVCVGCHSAGRDSVRSTPP